MSVVTLIVLVVILGIFYSLYVSLVFKKNKVKEASAGIDVQLKKRYDLIPNLVQMAKKYMEHETNLMTEITRLRTEVMQKDFTSSPKEMMALDQQVSARLRDLMVSVENYPNLKSDQAMNEAMQSLNETEEHIAAARRFYNSAVNDLKNAVEIFPSNLIAVLVGIRADMPYFEAETAAKERIDVKDYFK